jgi:hypothetical protein
VLGTLQPEMEPAPEGCISAFDAHRDRICTARRKGVWAAPERLLRLIVSEF